jgi:hypothetical protein
MVGEPAFTPLGLGPVLPFSVFPEYSVVLKTVLKLGGFAPPREFFPSHPDPNADIAARLAQRKAMDEQIDARVIKDAEHQLREDDRGSMDAYTKNQITRAERRRFGIPFGPPGTAEVTGVALRQSPRALSGRGSTYRCYSSLPSALISEN